MPKVLLGDRTSPKNNNITKKIKIRLIQCDMKVSELKKQLPIEETTIYSRLKHPENLSIKELRALCKALKISMHELLELEE